MSRDEVRRYMKVIIAFANGHSRSLIARDYPWLATDTLDECEAFVENCQALDRRAWCSWTPAEDARLRKLYIRRQSQRSVSEALGRSKNAINHRIDTLGLRPSPGGGRRAAA